MVAIRHFGVDPNGIDTVFVTHLHGDHFGGLPFLILDAQFISRRTRPLVLAGPPGLEQRLKGAMEVFFPGSGRADRRFALNIVELDPEVQVVVNGVAVTPYVVQHECGAPPFALRLEADGKVLAYSGDTEWTDALVPTARGADLFVCEASTYERKIKQHMDFMTLLAHLPEIGPKRLMITHMGPDMVDRPAPKGCDKAEDGMAVEI
jgi:ribonuclease BN (tRNA processing enzyme)